VNHPYGRDNVSLQSLAISTSWKKKGEGRGESTLKKGRGGRSEERNLPSKGKKNPCLLAEGGVFRRGVRGGNRLGALEKAMKREAAKR